MVIIEHTIAINVRAVSNSIVRKAKEIAIPHPGKRIARKND